jgi:hypothetical protein
LLAIGKSQRPNAIPRAGGFAQEQRGEARSYLLLLLRVMCRKQTVGYWPLAVGKDIKTQRKGRLLRRNFRLFAAEGRSVAVNVSLTIRRYYGMRMLSCVWLSYVQDTIVLSVWVKQMFEHLFRIFG